MLPPLVVFWLAAPAGHADVHGALEQWAGDRGYRPVAAAEAPRPAYDDAVAGEIETLLEETRAAAPEARTNFERLDQLLAAHPELPQAGWWAAERYALEAQSLAERTERDLVAERELTLRGLELEGPRAIGVAAGPASTGVDSVAREALRVDGLRSHDDLSIDGRSASPSVQLGPGRHHVQLFRSQRRVWAGWVELGSPPLLRVADPTAPCSELDLWGTKPGAQGPVAPPGVRCEAWAVARTRGTELELAFCRADRCGAWERRDAAPSPAAAAADVAPAPGHVPTWITWGAIGVGAAASTLVVLWQAGAFDRTAPATQFVFTGPTAAALRF